MQSNNYDCGIYCIGFAEYTLKEIVNGLDEQKTELRLDRMSTNYKYLLGNSGLARERYRRVLE